MITAAFVLIPGPISSLFFHEKDVVLISVSYLTIIGFGEAFMSVELMTIGALSGLGKTKLCSIISIIFTSARIPLALLLAATALGLNGIWWSISISSIIKGAILFCWFLIFLHKIYLRGRMKPAR